MSYFIHISVKLLNGKTDPSRINPAHAWLLTVVFKLSFEGNLWSLGLLGLEIEVGGEGHMSVTLTLRLCLEASCLLSSVQLSGLPSLLNSWAAWEQGVCSLHLCLLGECSRDACSAEILKIALLRSI